MTTNERIKLIRAGAEADLADVLAEPEPPAGPRHIREEWRIRRELAEDRVVDLATARWLGMPTLSHSESTMVSRALQAGAKRGLWVLQRWNGRTWGLKLRGEPDA